MHTSSSLSAFFWSRGIALVGRISSVQDDDIHARNNSLVTDDINISMKTVTRLFQSIIIVNYSVSSMFVRIASELMKRTCCYMMNI